MSHMHKPWGLLRRIVPHRAAPAREPDPGDMGTAFGLDFCLSDCDPVFNGPSQDAIEEPDALLRRLFSAPAPRG